MIIMEMMVHMDCHGCEKKVRRALENLDGVDGIEIDMDLQKVTVTGWVEQEDVLKVVRKTGRRAELWPFMYSSHCFGFTQHYVDLDTYNSDPMAYFQTEQHQELAYSTVPSETAFVAFSDDDVNACSIM